MIPLFIFSRASLSLLFSYSLVSTKSINEFGSLVSENKINQDCLTDIFTQISETERKQDILVKILKEVTAGCPKCKMDVAKRLSQITGIVEPITIEEASGV